MGQMPDSLECDILVVGGGINGAGIARDAAGRGLSVVLCEKDDLASHTSSASTKLIHGGLRYLEHYEFKLVRKALIEREVLLRSAPHIIRPLCFVMPHDRVQRPDWMIRAGLFLYDHLARRDLLPGSSGINLSKHITGQPLKSEFVRGFVYSDGWVDDARLVVLCAIDAAEKGAKVFTRTCCDSIVKQNTHWLASLRTSANQTIRVNARCVINAAGPWAAHVQQGITQQAREIPMRLIKGSHIVVKRLFDHPYAYIFQHSDGRIVFAIPYEQDFTLIGTTDIEYHDDANSVAISSDEIAYLCDLSNHYFSHAITPTDVVWSYSGVRPLVEDHASDAASVTRDYHFEFDNGSAPHLSIFGGKITTFRRLAEEAIDLVAPTFNNHHGHWTTDACLPGGDLFGELPTNRSVKEFDEFLSRLKKQYPWLPAELLNRYAHAYGTRINTLLGNRNSMIDLGIEIAPGLFAAEAEYWIKHEWATNATDMLWRRSKLGLHLPVDTATKLDAWIATYLM
ncbi:MAG: glycerol-3-phosphate dehydrogenase [Burkholderiaceae bacterium]